jgi:hypothetical protein
MNTAVNSVMICVTVCAKNHTVSANNCADFRTLPRCRIRGRRVKIEKRQILLGHYAKPSAAVAVCCVFSLDYGQLGSGVLTRHQQRDYADRLGGDPNETTNYSHDCTGFGSYRAGGIGKL